MAVPTIANPVGCTNERGSPIADPTCRSTRPDGLYLTRADPVDAPLFRDPATGYCYPYNGRGEPIRFANYGEAFFMHSR